MDRKPSSRNPRRRPSPGRAPVQVVELPPGLAPRIAAALAVSDVVLLGRLLDDALSAAAQHPSVVSLAERDRSLARSIATVSVRRLGTIRQVLAGLLEKGWPRKCGSLEWILIVTAAQILFLDIPDHAAVNACVQAVRHDPAAAPFAGLANAVARAIAREPDRAVVDDPFIDTPAWLAARWRRTYGEAAAAEIALAHRGEASLDVTVKRDASTWAERLGGDVLDTGSVRLRVHTPVPDLPGYADGSWWVQDAAAALPARLLRAEPGERVADLCAAPGGKTAQLCQTGAQVVAVDRSAERLKRLAVNLERLKFSADAHVADATTFGSGPFDAVLLDAPCSTTGTMRRHPDVGYAKRASDLPVLAALQARMLDRATTLLRPGGRLVYCVCSIEPEEGEAQIASLLRRNPDLVRRDGRADEVGGLVESLTPLGELRTLPHHKARRDPPIVGLDGFYAARLIVRG